MSLPTGVERSTQSEDPVYNLRVVTNPNKIVVGGIYRKFHFSHPFPPVVVLGLPETRLGLPKDEEGIVTAELGEDMPKLVSLQEAGLENGSLDNFLVRDFSKPQLNPRNKSELLWRPSRRATAELIHAVLSDDPRMRLTHLDSAAYFMRQGRVRLLTFGLTLGDIGHIATTSLDPKKPEHRIQSLALVDGPVVDILKKFPL